MANWEGDWPQRIHDCILAKGYGSVLEFAENNPKATFFDLAKELGDDVAPIQVEGVICDDYDKRGDVERYARSSLVRHVIRLMPNGWGVGSDFELKRASTFTDWERGLPGELDEYDGATDRVWMELTQSPILYRGWLPEGPDDEILVDIFQKAAFSSKRAA